ncbi:MAG: outer membrane beta-barrel protein [Bacteroidota bacterium]
MKKLLVLAAILLPFALTAQTEKGGFVIGGDVGLGFNAEKIQLKSDNTDVTLQKNTNFALAPGAGYFVIDNLAIGVEIPVILISEKEEEGNGEFKSTTFLFSPFARYYFTTGNVKPFVEGNVGIGSSNSETTLSTFEGTIESKDSVFAYGFEGGVAIFIADNISLDLGVGFSSTQNKPKDNNEINARVIRSGFGFNAGFSFFLK